MKGFGLFLICSVLGFVGGALANPSINLTQTEAMERSKKISDVRYEWDLHLKKEPAEYLATMQISFKLSDSSKPINLDFVNGEITELQLNGAKVKPIYNGVQIKLEQELLVEGVNLVKVAYKKKYNRDGRGLSYFKDPKDGRVYLSTQFQTIDASQAMPCFDQPDLKATYTLTVTAPQSWQVVTAVKEKKIKYNRQKERVWTFPESAEFSTYLLSLHAGPFKVWSDKYGKIPLRLFARRSLAQNVRPQDWFKFTKGGLKYFNSEFGYEYPFKKYDQLLIPEFNAGAMENVAAVTFSEWLVSRGKVTRDNRHSLAEIILHEMAHMWFGDLVTMKWWNDLWLNESFATYMSYKAMVATTDFDETWQKFFSRNKSWAYWEDQTVTTHPIEGDVPGTKNAETIFDGITYGKGSSVLKQLAYYLGEESFRKGVQNYFKKFAYKNTVRADFVGELAASSGKDLKGWVEKWLQTSGVNGIQVTPQCDAGKLKSLKVVQTKDESSKIFRPHRFQVALLGDKSGKVQVTERFVVDIDGAYQEIKIQKETPCPLMIYPNYQDYGYFRSQLNAETVEQLYTQLPKVDDVFLREMYWSTLWDMLREGELSVYKYAELIYSQGLDEPDLNILKSITRRLYAGYPGEASVEYYLPDVTPEQKVLKENELKRFEVKIWDLLQKAKAGSDEQLLWFDSYVRGTITPEAQTRLVQFLQNKVTLKGLKVDQDRRWSLVSKLAQLGHVQSKELMLVESKNDSSNRGKKSMLSIEVRLASWKEKKQYIDEVLSSDKYSFKEQRAIIGSIFDKGEYDARNKYTEEFFTTLKKLKSQKEDHILRMYTWLQPFTCREANSKVTEKFLKDNKDLSPSLSKSLKIRVQEDSKCRRILAKAQETQRVS
ncbi:MAG: aminopeptidase N [Bdellovibrionales bacterium]|nr:aminopeptidase N [Bdellovibrionales bacterium]